MLILRTLIKTARGSHERGEGRYYFGKGYDHPLKGQVPRDSDHFSQKDIPVETSAPEEVERKK